MSNEHFGAALLAIYDTATSPGHWPQALDAFARGIDSAGAILVAVDNVGLPFNIQQATSNFELEAVQYYFQNFGQYDEPIMSARLAQTPPFQILRDCDVWGDMSKLDDRPDYKYLSDHFGVRRRAGVRLSQNKGWMDRCRRPHRARSLIGHVSAPTPSVPPHRNRRHPLPRLAVQGEGGPRCYIAWQWLRPYRP